MIIESEFERKIFAIAVSQLREEADLSVETLAKLVGVTPALVHKWESEECLPTMEQANQLEKIFNWPLPLPPRELVSVTFGEWTKLYDERVAPLAREMLIAGFPALFFGMDYLKALIIWHHPQRAAAFLTIVAPFEAGTDTVYSRANPDAEYTGRLPKWSYELTIHDLNSKEDNDGREMETAYFLAGLQMTFPPHDLPTVTGRLRAYNEARDTTGKTGQTNVAPANRLCKVRLSGGEGAPAETVWATRIGDDSVIINNVPFLSNEVCLHDVVRISPSGDLLEVLERIRSTVRATYDAAPDKEEAIQQWKAIVGHFSSRNIECESAVPGMFCMAVPTTVGEDELDELCSQCPIPLKEPE